MRLIIILAIAVNSIGILGCNSGQDTNRNTSTNAYTPDSSRIKNFAANYIHGKDLFKKSCSICHIAPESHMTDQYIFDRLFQRLPPPPEDYFIRYIQDSRALKSSGDKYALLVDKAWDSDYEHYFKDSLSLQDLHDLIIYIKVADKQR